MSIYIYLVCFREYNLIYILIDTITLGLEGIWKVELGLLRGLHGPSTSSDIGFLGSRCYRRPLRLRKEMKMQSTSGWWGG